MERLNMPTGRARSEAQVREVGWAEFGDLARALGDRIGAAFRPEVVLGIVNGGVFVGGALAPALRAEFHPVRVQKDGQRRSVPEPIPGLRGKAVLVVDDVIVSGATMKAACSAARRAGARELRTAALLVRPDGAHPDFHAIETKELVVFGWDYGLDQGVGPGSGDPGELGV
jgi:hypoxanthine phosphoribosyltransferase